MGSCKDIIGYLTDEVFGVFHMEGGWQISEMYLLSSAILAKSELDFVLLCNES